jgi:NAD(P)-dependent dehydrogenase (short-subunit alcohol dehydrogenase family)
MYCWQWVQTISKGEHMAQKNLRQSAVKDLKKSMDFFRKLGWHRSALVEEAHRRGAQRVYAGTRRPFQHSDNRVTPLTLDVTNAAQIQRAVGQVDSLDVLINNAGIAMYDDLSKPEVIEQYLKVNLFGPLNVTRAFLPLLKRSKGRHRQ